MIEVGPLKVDERLVEHASEILREPDGLEKALTWLRSQGEHKIGSIKVLVRAAGMDLREAKRAVHLSETWADTRLSDDAFHESLQESAQALSQSDRQPRVA